MVPSVITANEYVTKKKSLDFFWRFPSKNGKQTVPVLFYLYDTIFRKHAKISHTDIALALCLRDGQLI